LAIKTLFFDAAGTLISPHPSVGGQYSAIAAEFGLDANADDLEFGFQGAFRLARMNIAIGSLPYGRTHEEARAFWRPVVERAFRLAGHTMPADPFFETVYDRFSTRACWRVFSDAMDAIAIARDAGVSVGMLSNFDPRLRPILQELDLTRHFDPIIISCEVGSEKPHAAIFEAARMASGDIGPMECALIGDTPGEDIQGAINAGWQACLIDRDGLFPDHDGIRATDLREAVRCVLA